MVDAGHQSALPRHLSVGGPPSGVGANSAGATLHSRPRRHCFIPAFMSSQGFFSFLSFFLFFFLNIAAAPAAIKGHKMVCLRERR